MQLHRRNFLGRLQATLPKPQRAAKRAVEGIYLGLQRSHHCVRCRWCFMSTCTQQVEGTCLCCFFWRKKTTKQILLELAGLDS